MKLINKIVPIVMALTLGISCVAAADLGTWKNDFKSGAVVVGAAADQLDIVAATNIAGVLGIQAIPVAGAGTAWAVEASGNEFNYGDGFDNIDAIIDDGDLPTILADGSFEESEGDTDNDVTYTQTLTFVAGGDEMVFDAMDDSPETATSYLFLDDGINAYDYTLTFDDAVEFTATEADVDDDFYLAKLKILGKEYSITDATSVADVLTEIQLMGGAVESTQGEYTTATYTVDGKAYVVKVVIISDDAETVKFDVNGEITGALAEGDTEELSDGTVIGVKEVMPNEGSEEAGADQATFYLGADKLILTTGDEANLNGEDIDGSLVTINTSAADEWTVLKVDYMPEDNVFIAAGESWTDPVFGKFKFDFKDLTKTTEMITIATASDEGSIKVTDISDNDVEIPLVDNDVNVFFGDDLVDADVCTAQDGGAAVEAQGNLLIHDGDSINAEADIELIEGVKMLVVSAGGEARIIEITNIDVATDTVDLKDLTTGKTWDDKVYTAAAAIDLGYTHIHLTVDETDDDNDCTDGDGLSVTATSINAFHGNGLAAASDFQTSLGGEVDLDLGDVADVEFELYEGDDGTSVGSVEFDIDGDADMIMNNIVGMTLMDENEDSDIRVDIDNHNWGALWTFDDENDDDMTIEYPEEQVIANVAVTELTGESTGTSKTYYTDAEATTTFAGKPVIAIGGSAINKISATLLGLTYPTYGTDASWVTATGVDADGKGIIKYIASPTVGKVAMLVAGYSAADTSVLGTMLKEGTPVLSGTTALMDTVGKKLITA